MTDKQYREQKKRVSRYIDKWFKTLGLGWFSIDMEWSRDICDYNKNTAASTNSSWQYKSATITWYLPAFIDRDDKTLEQTVVHEFSHVLLSGLAQNVENNDSDYAKQINEYTTEVVANAIMWSREADK